MSRKPWEDPPPTVYITAVFHVECRECDTIVGSALTCTAADRIRAAHAATHAGAAAARQALATAIGTTP